MNIAHSQIAKTTSRIQAPITLRPKLPNRILPLVIALGPFFFLTIYFLNSLPIFIQGIGTTTYLSDTPGLGTIIGGLVLLGILIGFALVMLKVYQESRLAFYDTYFELWPHLTLLHPPLRIAYDEVVQLNPDFHGHISVKCSSGKIHRIAASSYVGGPSSVLNQLIANLDPALIRPNLIQQVNAWHWWDFIAYVIVAASLICFFVFWPTSSNQLRPQSLVSGWETQSSYFYPQMLQLLALDQNNEPYVLLSTGQGSAHVLRHYTASGATDVTLPASFDLTAPYQMLIDPSGHVWITQYFANKILMWDGNKWTWIEMSSTGEAALSPSVLSNGKLWMVINSEKGKPDLAILDTRTQAIQSVKFSDLVQSTTPLKLYALKNLPDGTLGALAAYTDSALDLYRLQANGDWQKYTTAINLPKTPAETFAMDSAGNIWLTVETYCTDRTANQIQRTFYRINSEGALTEQSLAADHDCNNDVLSFIKDLYIDPYNRLWLSEDSGLNVFQIQSDESLSYLKTYTAFNSNYQDSLFQPFDPLRVSSKNVIWSIGDKAVSTFDTSRTDLPPTLPNWQAKLLSDRSAPTNILLGIMCFNVAIIALVKWYVMRHHSSK